MQNAKIKNQNVVRVAVLGEKDHGKSTLIGRLLYETGSVPEDRLREIKKASKKSGIRFEWAHLLDSFRYEREREMTLDTTRAFARLGKNLYEFIDVPGHKQFIRNMLTGASDATCGILVIDVKEGIAPQTLKHIEIAQFLGIEKILIAVNKIDKISYSVSLFKKAEKIFADILQHHGVTYKTSFIPIAASWGHNLIKKTLLAKRLRKLTLAGSIQKNFQLSAGVETRTFLSKRSHCHKATCLFVEKPQKKLVLESGLASYPILKLLGFKKTYSPQAVIVKLARATALKKKFVVKSKGRIIGMCAHN